jgi:folate-binding Fe-S cluster repair protein YgfZ
MLQMRGRVTRKLLPLAFTGDAAGVAPETEVHAEGGAVVGKVTSFVAGPSPRALALLKTSSGEPGTSLLVGGASAKVASPPSEAR